MWINEINWCIIMYFHTEFEEWGVGACAYTDSRQAEC